MSEEFRVICKSERTSLQVINAMSKLAHDALKVARQEPPTHDFADVKKERVDCRNCCRIPKGL